MTQKIVVIEDSEVLPWKETFAFSNLGMNNCCTEAQEKCMDKQTLRVQI